MLTPPNLAEFFTGRSTDSHDQQYSSIFNLYAHIPCPVDESPPTRQDRPELLRKRAFRPIAFALAIIDREESMENILGVTRSATALVLDTKTTRSSTQLCTSARKFITSTKPMTEFSPAIQNAATENVRLSI
jgi:hypothetical protein